MPIAPPDPTTLARPHASASRARSPACSTTSEWDSGYSKQQSTRPQTLGYGLVDSPAGQAAWILEKFWAWTDCDGHPENVLTRDELLDNVMLYWLPGTGASSARLYWESFRSAEPRRRSRSRPAAASSRRRSSAPRGAGPRSASRTSCYWNELERGGHFAAFEQPELFVRRGARLLPRPALIRAAPARPSRPPAPTEEPACRIVFPQAALAPC